jgi:purine nucleosidase
MRRQLLCSVMLAAAAFACRTPTADPLNVIVDQDGGVDDMIAISLLMKSPAVRVRAITICPADSYLEPATRLTQLFVDRVGGRDIAIAQGHNEGINPFPDAWRRDAARALDIPAFTGLTPGQLNPVVKDDAAHRIAGMLSGGTKYTILATGPMTNIADALELNPSIKDNVTRIYVMGGAMRVKGNVEQPGHDGSAEWNIFNHAKAADAVVRSGIPITLIPLDATNHVPLTPAFLDRLRAQPSVASQLAVQAWGVTYSQQQQGVTPYYFWDTLTAAALLDRTLVTLTHMKIRVVTDGASQGRTLEDPSGTSIEVALDASQSAVERTFIDVLNR